MHDQPRAVAVNTRPTLDEELENLNEIASVVREKTVRLNQVLTISMPSPASNGADCEKVANPQSIGDMVRRAIKELAEAAQMLDNTTDKVRSRSDAYRLLEG